MREDLLSILPHSGIERMCGSREDHSGRSEWFLLEHRRDWSEHEAQPQRGRRLNLQKRGRGGDCQAPDGGVRPEYALSRTAQSNDGQSAKLEKMCKGGTPTGNAKTLPAGHEFGACCQ